MKTESELKTATQLITDERDRQISKEGWTIEHDDQHIYGELAKAAATETRLRVESLFKTQHPYFGKAANGTPSAKESFEIGLKLGEQKK